MTRLSPHKPPKLALNSCSFFEYRFVKNLYHDFHTMKKHWNDYKSFLEFGGWWVVEGIVQNGSCIEFKIEVKFVNNKIKMWRNQTNNHHVQKDNFGFVENGYHEAQDQCSLWGQ